MRNKFSKLLTGEYPPLGNKGIFAKTWKYAACMLLAFFLGIGQMWAADTETVDCSSASATSSTGNTNKSTSTSYTVYFTRGGGGWSVNSEKGYQGKSDAIAVFKLTASTDVKMIISNSGGSNRTFTAVAKPFKTVALGEEFISILEYSNANGKKYADCVSASKNLAGLPTTSAFYDSNAATSCSLSNEQLSTTLSYTTGNQTLNASATKIEYGLGTLPAGVYAVGFSVVSNSNVSLAGFKFTPAASYTITYDANGGTGTMENSTNTVAANGFTYDGKDFVEWNTKSDGTGGSYDPGDVAASDLDLFAIWEDHVAKYTLIYKVDGTEVDRETVNVSGTPAGITDPSKDCYTFAGWSPALTDVTGTDGAEVETNATWTPRYASSFDFGATTDLTKSNIVSKLDAVNIACTVGTSGSYDNGATNGYLGYKFKNKNDKVVFLLKQGWQATITYGYTQSGWTVNGTDAGVATATQAYVDKVYTAPSSDVLYTLVNQSEDSKTSVITKIVIAQLYDATLNDAKSDGSDSKTSVATVTLPTPTAVSGWTYTGWKANKDVKDSEGNTQTEGTLLAAGTYTLLDNTTFTAQWTEETGTYDVEYVSAHGSAPAAANAGSVVLAELTEDGWKHMGWKADVDVEIDAATVNAGDLIENGKTVILAGDVTFTAVWKEIFTITFDSKDGSAVAPVDVEDGASLAAAPTAPTKDNYVFLGWSETDGGAVVADITALTITDDKTLYAKWALDVQITELVFSNSFKGWINGSNIEVFYMAGESAPTIVSYEGKNLKAADAVAIVGDEVVATGSDDSKKHYTLTMTAVTPLTATGEQIFDGSEGYVKTRHAWTSDRKWKMSKSADDGRIPRGDCSMYFFLGAAESVTFNWGKQQKTEDVAVYVNGTFVKNIGKDNNSAISLTGSNNMVAFYSLQTSGDVWLNGLTVVAYVPTTGVTLKEGEDAISSKTIWAGTNFTLTATVTPDNASDKTITWTSSNDAIATVVNGVVTGVAANATPATITATTVDGVSATCVVTVIEAPAPCETPTINTQPATQAYCAGSEPTLTVDAGVTDGGTLHYAWFKDDAAIGSDAATCLVDGAGTYKVVVTNHVDGKLDASVTSDNAVITLNVAAAITTQPTNKSEIVSGSSVTLSLVATNATSYQWYSCDDAEKANAAAISGAEAADYVFTCTANGYYYCEVGNACGAAVVSNVVSVKLEPEGCNTLASIPSAEPYQYEQAGEWTLYCVSSDGTLLGSNKFTDEGKDFDGNTDVNALLDKRFAIKFAKDVESVTIYAEGGTGRTFNKVYISSEMTKNTYSELEGVTKQMVNAETNRQYILTVTGIIPADQYAWFELSGSLGVFKICYTEALAKPTIPTLSNQELCSGESYAEIDATSTKTGEGTLSYQWYDATDEEHPVVIDGANSATFTPTADGKYYVEVTNAAAGHVSNKAKSNTINVAHFAATEITTALENQRKDAGQDATLTVVASGKNLHYAWKECATIDGTYADVAGATDAPSLTVTVTAGMDKYYKVIVSSDCGSAVESIARVEEWTELPQVAVSANTTWDMANVTDAAIELTGDNKNAHLLLANVKGVNNNATFNAQALMFEGQHIGRIQNSVKHLAGRYLQFNVTVPGVVFVTFASNGDNQRTIRINANKCTETTNANAYITFATAVNAGSVEIMGIQDESENQYVRISKVVFKATPDYKRDASTGDDWMAPGELGTVCIPNGAVATGGDLYELVGKNEVGKIVFATVPNNRMTPGVPYLFQATSNAMKFFYTEEDAADDPDNSGAMKGTFTAQNLTDLENVYYFAGHALWGCSDLTSLEVKANRAWVVLDDNVSTISTSNPAPGRRYITMEAHGQNAATGIGNVQGDEVQSTKVIIDGHLYILRGEKMYDATGRMVK